MAAEGRVRRALAQCRSLKCRRSFVGFLPIERPISSQAIHSYHGIPLLQSRVQDSC